MTTSEEENNQPDARITTQSIEAEMKKSYLDYAMSVIVGRALPDVRDGLKPVHRRILFAMHELGLHFSKSFKKSARIVGEVLGKYHPHGDTAVYDSLVRMAQPFSLRYPLVVGQGNFGSIDGDRAAAMRYTEAKLSKLAEEMLTDIEKDTVEFFPNFDESLKEPLVLPSKIPNLLVNGSSGIAVGMATSSPPHNLQEVCDAVIHLIETPDAEIAELVEYIQGPDFPTGAEILGKQGILHAYTTGHGIVRVRAVMHEEEHKGKKRLIVTEIPYMVNKSTAIAHIANLVKDKKITEISDLRDESAKQEIRIVIELKKDANAEVVKNKLYNYSHLQTSFSINLLALVNNEPRILNLRQVLKQFIHHRQEIVRRRTQFDLQKAEDRAHILDGLVIALDNIDPIVTLIKKSPSAQAARDALMNTYDLSEKQSAAVLDMKLQKLAALEQDKIRSEQEEIKQTITQLKYILDNPSEIDRIIKEELTEIKEKYGDKRKTAITEWAEDIDMEDLIKDETVVVSITRSGYIKRIPLETYKVQNRGGKGVIGATTKEEDVIEHLFITNAHAYLLIFTDDGKVHWLKTWKVPETSRQSMGKAIINLLQLPAETTINTIIPVNAFEDDRWLVMATARGIIKKTQLKHYARPRQGGIIAVALGETDKLVSVLKTDGKQNIILATKDGLASKFKETDIREVGRNAKGVIGIRLRPKDIVVGMVNAVDEHQLLTITENGYGKRSSIADYRLINRGGRGVINIQCTERNGKVVTVRAVTDEDELLFMSKHGIIIRTSAKSISCIGRNTQGVRLMKLRPGDKVVAAAKIVSEEADPILENEDLSVEQHAEDNPPVDDEPERVENN